jgi:predicted ArsR family transcriptional regulator
MKTVRERILEYVRTHRGVTVTELSKAFQMTPANARHHLSKLAQEGLLQAFEHRPGSGRGRPAHIYTLSEESLGDNFDLLAGIMLDQFAHQFSAEQFDSWLHAIAGQLARKMSAKGEQAAGVAGAGENLTRRLYRAIETFNQHHYQARWEARPDAPRLVLGHCPFIAIVDEHPELCKLDAYLIENYTSMPVEQTAKLAHDSSGLRFCMFRVGKERV